MSDLETKAVDILDKLDALTTQYAPDVVDKTIQAVVITGISNLVYALVGFLAMYGSWYATKKMTAFCIKQKEKNGYMSDWETCCILANVIGGSVCFAFAMVSIRMLFDVWNWIAIFNPELALAHRVLGL